MDDEGKQQDRGKFAKGVSIAATTLLLALIPLSIGPGPTLARAIVIVSLVWLVLVVMIVAGPIGRGEVERIVERPFDERERAIRTRALSIALAAVVLFNLGWIVYSFADDRDAIAPGITVLLSGAVVLLSIEVLRRRGWSPAAHDPFEETEDQLESPTWMTTVIAWLLASVVVGLTTAFVMFIPQQFGIPEDIAEMGGAREYLGASGWQATLVFAIFVTALTAVETLVFCLGTSRWLIRPVSFGWMFAYWLAAFAMIHLLFPEGGLDAFLVLLASSLFVLRYVATGKTMKEENIAKSLMLSRRALIAILTAAGLGFVVACAFGTTHPLSLELATNALSSKTEQGRRPEEPYFTDGSESAVRMDLRDGPARILSFSTENRGANELTSVRIAGVESSPEGAVTLEQEEVILHSTEQSPAPGLVPFGTSPTVTMPSGTEADWRLRLKFDCTSPGREITVEGLKFDYETAGRSWSPTVPMTDLIVTCPR